MNGPQLPLFTEPIARTGRARSAGLDDMMGNKRLSDSRARRDDPETSHAAAARSIEFSGKHASAIYCWLADHPEGGTAHEIAKGTGIDAVAVSRRIKELRGTAGVYDSGLTRRSPTGRASIVWKVRPKEAGYLA